MPKWRPCHRRGIAGKAPKDPATAHGCSEAVTLMQMSGKELPEGSRSSQASGPRLPVALPIAGRCKEDSTAAPSPPPLLSEHKMEKPAKPQLGCAPSGSPHIGITLGLQAHLWIRESSAAGIRGGRRRCPCISGGAFDGDRNSPIQGIAPQQDGLVRVGGDGGGVFGTAVKVLVDRE